MAEETAGTIQVPPAGTEGMKAPEAPPATGAATEATPQPVELDADARRRVQRLGADVTRLTERRNALREELAKMRDEANSFRQRATGLGRQEAPPRSDASAEGYEAEATYAQLHPDVLKFMHDTGATVASLQDRFARLDEEDADDAMGEATGALETEIYATLSAERARMLPGLGPKMSSVIDRSTKTAFRERFQEHFDGGGTLEELLAGDSPKLTEMIRLSLDEGREALAEARQVQAAKTAEASRDALLSSSGTEAEPQPEELLLRGPGWRQKIAEKVRTALGGA